MHASAQSPLILAANTPSSTKIRANVNVLLPHLIVSHATEQLAGIPTFANASVMPKLRSMLHADRFTSSTIILQSANANASYPKLTAKRMRSSTKACASVNVLPHHQLTWHAGPTLDGTQNPVLAYAMHGVHNRPHVVMFHLTSTLVSVTVRVHAT